MIAIGCDLTDITFGLSRHTDVASVQDQPVVSIDTKRFGNMLFQGLLDSQDSFSGGDPGSVGNTEDVGVHRNRGFPESGI